MAAKKRRSDNAQSPLGREFARLESWQTENPELDTYRGERVFRADELAAWVCSVGDSKYPLGPQSACPNPCVVGDAVLCSLFSPGKVVAFDRVTGVHRWSLRLEYYGKSYLYHPAGSNLVYGGTCQELLAIRPDSGRVEWTFCPYGRKGETIYSSPTLASDRLLVGDRRGILHCLAAATGDRLWQVKTSRADNNDVNSCPVVHGGVAVVGTNARLALGYDVETGREIWRQRIDGPGVQATPAADGAVLLCTRRSAYLFAVADGTLMGRRHRRYREVEQACSAGDLVLLVTQRVWGKDRLPWPVAELRAYRGGEEVYVRPYPRWAMATVRYEPRTGKVYEATAHGLGILNPVSGTRETVITGFGCEEGPCGRVSHPFVGEGLLYLLSETGKVYALRHP